jgi:hypothetical protein
LQNPDVLPLRPIETLLPLKQRIIKDRCPYQCYNGKYQAGQPIRNDTFQLESNNMSHYKAFDHHLEINQSVNQLQADYTNRTDLYRIEGILRENFLRAIEESLEDISLNNTHKDQNAFCNGHHY